MRKQYQLALNAVIRPVRVGVCLLSVAAFQSAYSGFVTTSNSTGVFAVSGSDLLQSAGVRVDALQLNVNLPESAGYTVPSLTDGLFPDDDRALAIANGVVTYYLDTAVHTNGYDINVISTYGGWVNWARSLQQYSVAYATVQDPGNFIELIAHVDSGYYFADSPSYTSVVISNIVDGPLAVRVGAIRFTFPDQLNGGAGYREFDVFGSPAGPLLAADVAEAITAVTTPMRGATQLTLPEVPTGFDLSVKSSSQPGIISINGIINPPPTNTVVELVLTATDLNTGATADAGPISLLVPAAAPGSTPVPYTENFTMRRGLFIHWSAPPDSNYNPIVFSDGGRSCTIDEFTGSVDVPAVVREIASFGFEYVLITDFHGYHSTLHPCAALDSWRGSGWTSTRDLIGEMIAALKAAGIRVYLFTHPLDGFNKLTPELQVRLGWFDPAAGYRRWNDYVNDVYAELTERYGDDIAGFGFDSEFGMISSDTLGKLDLPRLRETILSRRPHLSLHGLAGPNDTVELAMKEVWRPSWLDPWGSRSDADYDVETWPAYYRFAAIVQGYHWATITLPENGMARLTGEQMFRYGVLQAGVATEGPGVCWAASPYTDGTWENGVDTEFATLAALEQPIRESLQGVLPSTSYPREEGVWLANLPQGVAATRAVDDSVEYIHVLNPPAGDTLLLPLPEDGKRFTSASLPANGHPVLLATNATEVRLTLGEGDSWDAYDTVIKLRVDPESIPRQNHALHKSVSVSSSVQNGTGWGVSTPWGQIRLVDGQTAAVTATNGWSTGNYGYSSVPAVSNHAVWVGVDLGSIHGINAVCLHPRNDGRNVGYGYPVDFEVRTSIDGFSWSTAVSKSDQPLPAAKQTYSFSMRSARYVMLAVSQLRANPNDNAQYSLQLAEFEALGYTNLSPLAWCRAENVFVLEWDGGFLQSSEDLTAGFSDVPIATSPYTNDLGSGAARQFYRIRY